MAGQVWQDELLQCLSDQIDEKISLTAAAPPPGFDWDADKYARNLSKHGIAFEQAIFAFDDPNGLTLLGGIVDGERRDVWIGMVTGQGSICCLYRARRRRRHSDHFRPQSGPSRNQCLLHSISAVLRCGISREHTV